MDPEYARMDQWRKTVNAVAFQEDYVKSLERRVESMEHPDHRRFVQSLLDFSRERLIRLRSQLKELDEGEENGQEPNAVNRPVDGRDLPSRQ